jgi:polyisoprenoid-binding protein YceI
MMVSNVRGHFKNVEGKLDFDPESPMGAKVDVTIDAAGLWTGEDYRDGHLKSEDFLDVENYPLITFKGTVTEMTGPNDFTFNGDLTIRGVTQPASLDVNFHGTWDTPWWEGDEDKGPKTRAGFEAVTVINRHDFGVSWNDSLDKGGVVVGDLVEIVIDVEAIMD